MKDFLKNVVNLGVGALVITKEKAEKIADELVKKGEFGQEEGRKFVNELIEKGEESKKEITAQIEDVVKGVLEKLDMPTRKELSELKSQIEELKQKLESREE